MKKTIESSLMSIYKEWEEEVLSAFLKVNSGNKYSKPFVNLSGFESNDRKKILIIGQEARDFFNAEGDESMEFISEYINNFTKIQLENKNHTMYLTSPFWRFFRELSTTNNVLWGNLDKIHKYIDNRTAALSVEEEIFLHKPLKKYGKSLIMLEIEILKPDMIIFLVGPSYRKSLFYALGFETLNFEDKITPSNPVQSIDIENIDSKIIWTYHPKYLIMSKNYNSVLDTIKNKLI